MSKGIVLSILCMPLVSFGMDIGFTDQDFNDFDMMLAAEQDLSVLDQSAWLDVQELNDAALQAEIISWFTDDNAAVSSKSDAVNTQSGSFLPGQSPQISMYSCDESLDDADKEDAQFSTLYSNAAQKRIQIRHAINKKICPITQCREVLSSPISVANHAAAKHSICLLCKPPYCAGKEGMKQHFKEKHPLVAYASRDTKIACGQCGKVINVISLKSHAEKCKKRNGIHYRYTQAALEELKRRYKTNKTQCPLLSCLKFLRLASQTVGHAADKHNICLLCELPYCANTEDMKQHFQEKHPSAPYVIRNRKIACVQCGKEMLVSSMARHLRNGCKRIRTEVPIISD